MTILHKYLPTLCVKCNKLHHGECPIHEPLPELDLTVGHDQASLVFTELPVPAQLNMKASYIPGSGLGVFATSFIPKDVKLGQFEGKKVTGEDVENVQRTDHVWKVGTMF